MPENAPSAGTVVRFGVFELDTGAGELRRSGIKVKVQGQPLLLLDKLVQRPGEVITREDLQRALWPGDTFVDFERSLNTAVQRLRFALSDSSESPRFVETIPRRGYRFIAPVDTGHATPRRLVHEVPQIARPSEPQVAPPTSAAGAEQPAAPAARVRQAVVLLTTGVTAALLAGVLVWSVARPDPAMVTRVVIDLPSGQYLLPGVSPIVVSSDGSRLVYAAQQQGSSQLHLRELDQFLSRPLPGTENAEGPFFSPDAQWVGFFADGQLKKVRASGGEPVSLCDVPGTTFGATWGPSDTIVFASAGSSGLLRVPAGGGTPQPLTRFDEVSGDTSHRLPQFLPGGESILFTIQSQDGSTTALLPLTEDGGQPHILTALGQAGGARYVSTGHLLYVQSGRLWAAGFDPAYLELTGPPASVLDGVYTHPPTGSSYFTVSDTGTLVYAPGSTQSTLVWVDRQGRATPIRTDQQAYWYPRVSPDGTRIAVVARSESGNRDVWVDDVQRGTRVRLTTEGTNIFPVWAPDGEHVTFASDRSGVMNVYQKRVDGTEAAVPILQHELFTYPFSWSADGRLLTFYELHPTRQRDVWVMSRDGEASAVVATASDEKSPTLSPDGRWLAYVSNESGKDEVYVQPYPAANGRIQISTNGGTEPQWARDGTELFYRRDYEMVAVPVSAAAAFGKPEVLFEGQYAFAVGGNQNYDVSPDGRFVMLRSARGSSTSVLNVVLNWFEELRTLVAAN